MLYNKSSLAYKFLFASTPDNKLISTTLLLFRLLFGILLISHGLQKALNFETLAVVFPDPLGIGSQMSLLLAIFGEVFCSVAFVFGFLYRLAMIPMIFTMFIAFFVIHSADPFATKELAFVYLLAFVILFIAGPGKYSVDLFIAPKSKE